MTRVLVALVALLFLVASALAGDDLEAIFERFDHAEHAPSFKRHDISCVVCHAVGAPAPGRVTADKAGAPDRGLGAPARPLTVDRAVCHTCHAPGEGDLGVGDGLRAAPDRCGNCHPTVAPPASHVAGWLELHGADARSGAARCDTCHTRSTCVDCHDRRQNGAYNVHDASWLQTHGVAVRAAPASCDTCHAQAECLSCHSSPAGFGRGR